MKLKSQKQLASRALGISPKRIKFQIKTAEDKKEFSEIISRENIRELVQDGKIKTLNKKGNSRTNANKIVAQKKKGRQVGQGSRKGTANARMKDKTKWIIKLRAMRKLLKDMKEEGRLETAIYRDLYRKAKGNFFRNKKHIMLYIKQNELALKVEGKKSKKKEVKQ